MNDMNEAELRNWLLENRESWQRVQKYIDNLIDSVSQEAIEYIKDYDIKQIAECRGRIDAYEKIRDMDKELTVITDVK